VPEGPPIDCPSLDVMPPRGRIRAAGYVENIRILPASEAPAYAASVVDAPAPPGGRRRPVPRVRLVWIGQRRVPGVFAGTRLRFAGTVARVDGVPTIFNPRYEILPETDEPETQA
jgi:hypothetical protein